jgi:membrane-associated phospholipid phosphatase
MRDSEWIQIGSAFVFAVAAWISPLSADRRKAVTALAVVAIAILGIARALVFILPSGPIAILRDWLPVPLMLIPYWQTGQFFRGPNQRIQAWLLASDEPVFRLAARMHLRAARPVYLTMEWAYSLCYGMATAGIGVLYALELSRYSDLFWVMVLTPTFLCYAVTPFVPALPPRSVAGASTVAPRTKSRVFNLWLQKYLSIQAISFPSAHVASALAISLVLLRLAPVAGWVFLVITFWIAVAAVVGRYHYAIDVVLGAVVTLIVFAVLAPHLMPNNLPTTPASAFLARP